MTVTSMLGCFESAFANAKPPTPAPAMMTFMGWVGEISWINPSSSAPSSILRIPLEAAPATPSDVGLSAEDEVMINLKSIRQNVKKLAFPLGCRVCR